MHGLEIFIIKNIIRINIQEKLSFDETLIIKP